ncbi:MAG: hypothetical protein MUP74_04570 [Desulfobacterales bacterium]|nr:hypothetical protein [Desulfobacterales bacterium]
MGTTNPKNLWLEPFFDVSQPFVYVLVIIPLVLFALGWRRFALTFFLGAAGILAILGTG